MKSMSLTTFFKAVYLRILFFIMKSMKVLVRIFTRISINDKSCGSQINLFVTYNFTNMKCIIASNK